MYQLSLFPCFFTHFFSFRVCPLFSFSFFFLSLLCLMRYLSLNTHLSLENHLSFLFTFPYLSATSPSLFIHLLPFPRSFPYLFSPPSHFLSSVFLISTASLHSTFSFLLFLFLPPSSYICFYLFRHNFLLLRFTSFLSY